MTADDLLIINSLEVVVHAHRAVVERIADADDPTADPLGAALAPEVQLALADGFDILAGLLRQRNGLGGPASTPQRHQFPGSGQLGSQ